MLEADPQGYFERCQLRETRVLGFAFDEAQHQVRLDVDYAAENVSHWFEAKLAGVSLNDYHAPPSDFRRFIFYGASWVEIDSKSYLRKAYLPNGWMNVLEKDDSRLPVISSFQVVTTGNGFAATIILDQRGEFRFGFAFRSLAVQRRLGYGKLLENNQSVWEDIDTHLTFDYFEPFPNDL